MSTYPVHCFFVGVSHFSESGCPCGRADKSFRGFNMELCVNQSPKGIPSPNGKVDDWGVQSLGKRIVCMGSMSQDPKDGQLMSIKSYWSSIVLAYFPRNP